MAPRFFAALSALAALCMAAPAHAEASGSDPARLAAAQRLLDAMHYDSLIDRTLEAIVAESQHSVAANLNEGLDEPLPADLVTKIQDIVGNHIRQAINDHRAELKRGTALIYARHFTIDELGRLAELQSDPVMTKMQVEMPQITAEAMALSSGLVASAKASVQDEVKAAVVDYLQRKGEKPAT